MKSYLIAAVSVALLYFIGSGIYDQVNKKTPKRSELACQKEVVVFDKVMDAKALVRAKEAIKHAEVSIVSSVKKSRYMKSRLFEYVDIKEVDALFKEEIKKLQTDSQGKSDLRISYYIYENDKKDPGKKSPKAFKYAGYLHVMFHIDNKPCYTVQIDFMDMEGKDIPKRIACVFETFMHRSVD